MSCQKLIATNEIRCHWKSFSVLRQEQKGEGQQKHGYSRKTALEKTALISPNEQRTVRIRNKTFRINSQPPKPIFKWLFAIYRHIALRTPHQSMVRDANASDEKFWWSALKVILLYLFIQSMSMWSDYRCLSDNPLNLKSKFSIHPSQLIGCLCVAWYWMFKWQY